MLILDKLENIEEYKEIEKIHYFKSITQRSFLLKYLPYVSLISCTMFHIIEFILVHICVFLNGIKSAFPCTLSQPEFW